MSIVFPVYFSTNYDSNMQILFHYNSLIRKKRNVTRLTYVSTKSMGLIHLQFIEML